ncbi:class I SAM-dependent RNA methyltransferase [Jannaschia sp. LMIT008]|uniref:class I SAM-dependent RNA methyltransferase n=1 Tax=Jannaschia maritima TaxID=3032585 RepID=UPI002810CAAB|nr:class I SAM-dependent RNA methyltransferase [Jannaschia sp. LMIT008]
MTDGLTIARLDARGDGVAGDGTRAPRVLPGEVVAGAVTDGRIEAPRILTPSPDRVAAPCAHFRRCGGCSLQHASDAFASGWKRDRVATALNRVRLAAEVGMVHVSPPRSRRRAALKGRKTKKGAVVGLHAPGTHDLVAIPDCHLLHPDLMAALPALEGITRLAAPRGAEIGLHLTRTATGLDLALHGAKAVDPSDLAPHAPPFARITADGEPLLQSDRPRVALGGTHVVPPPGAFLQATEDGERVLTAIVIDALRGAARIADLFCGLGTFTFPAARIAPVDAWDGDAPAVAALRDGARRATGCKPIRASLRNLFRDPLTPDDLSGFDAVILDPPRAGCAAQVQALAASDVARVVHVSCNPESFARDAATLGDGGYAMGPVALVDQFRWSTHVELVAVFRRA